MTNPVFNPEDPRLTAFVLGEIDDRDRAEIEQLLEASPEAQAAVKEIEETIGVLKQGLAAEPAPELTAEQRAAVEDQLAGGIVSASSTSGADGSAELTPRAGARVGKLAGVLISACALGLLVTVVLPAFQGDDEWFVTSRLRESNGSGDMVAMSSAPSMEEQFTVRAAVADESEEFRADTPADHFEGSEAADLSVADARRVFAELPRESRPAATSSVSSRPQASPGSDRAEADFASTDRALTSLPLSTQPVPAGKPDDFGRSSATKDSTVVPKSRRMIADSKSQSESGSRIARFASEGASSATARPVSEPAVASAEISGNGSAVAPSNNLSDSESKNGGGFAGSRTAPGSSGLALDKSRQVVGQSGSLGGRGMNGPRAGSSSPAVPRSSASSGDSQPTPAPGYTGQGTVGGAVADLSAPGHEVALVPGQNQPEKRVLYFDETAPVSGKKVVLRSDPSAEVLQQIREQEEALVRESRTERLAERSNEVAENQKQTQLAAIDRELSRRGRVNGFGLEGRDLQEQLRNYSDGLHRMRTTLERRPAGRTSGVGNEYYVAIVENDFVVPVIGDREKSLSTISVDVDTASYANMRRFLTRDQLPPADSVRIEELVNYFNYNYPEPEGNDPFSVKTELATCPWQPAHRLAMIGLKARTIEKVQRPPTNLVFLLDVSGSMRASNKLPLVQQSMRLLVEEMTEDDRISIVTYASNAGVRLQSTLGSKKQEILAAINGLRAGGSTNGEGGIRMAYDEANRYYFQGGANRVILCSDGDFNVGKSSDDELVELIQEKAASGVFLSVFGFGMGNLKDAKLEKLADKGNGHYGYIDNLNEAKKVFQDELVGTLYTVAKDVKLQVEFNPATVGAYRLIGYENRKLAAQDFADDTKDAGEIGSGHTVTALYEIIPKQVLLEQPRVDGLKYQSPSEPSRSETVKNPTTEPETPEDDPAATETQPARKELLTVKLRYKKPEEEVSQPVQQEFPVEDIPVSGQQLSGASDDLLFAASVASFGMNLRGSKYRGNWGFAEALETAQGALGDASDPQRTEFVQLVQRAMRITGQQVGPQPRTGEGTASRPTELGATEARLKASVEGKYRRLVKKIEVRDDFQRFGSFNDYGHWDGTEYAGYRDLPPGHWVYVYPNWYIWAEVAASAPAASPAEDAGSGPGSNQGERPAK